MTSWRPARGISLIETVVGTVLLATLLVAVLTATGRMKAQGRRIAQRAEAVGAIEDLCRRWWADLPALPRSGAGEVPGRPGWRWQTRTLDRPDAAAVHGQVVQVDVLAPAWQDPLPTGRIELLLPPPPPPPPPPESNAT